MSAGALVRAVPEKPISIDEVLARWPVVRQSNLSRFDDCELASLFGIRYENGYSTSPQARGTIEHRVFAECLREMQRHDSEGIEPHLAEAILLEKLRQIGVAPEDRVRVPLHELPDMLMATRKWAYDNSFGIRDLIDVEREIKFPLEYRNLITGELITRVLQGTLDALLLRRDDEGVLTDEAIVIDWKGTWGLPPKREEDNNEDGGGLSYHGFFQQKFYAIGVMENFSTINAVVLREFYHRRSQARPARMTRQDLPKAKEQLAILVEAFDLALASGRPPALTIEALEKHGHWKGSPGKHCFNCAKAHLCPIDDDYKDGGIRTPEDAERAAAARQIARSVDKRLTGWLKTWVDLHGPVKVKRAKGRLVLGYRKIAGGKKVRFEEFTPEASDRPATREAYDPNSDISKAMKESVIEARKERER